MSSLAASRFEPVMLEGTSIRLEPLTRDHRSGLIEAVRDGELWKLFVTRVPSPDRMDDFLAEAGSWVVEGRSLAFATIDRTTGRVVGSTRFMNASFANRRVEIGYTFLAASHQRTAANTEAKLLMLTHAFDTLRLNRVELLTDCLNRASRRAIERIGAKQEAILRSHMVMADDRVRDSALYSVIRAEWPGVEQNLRFLLRSNRRVLT